VSERIEALKLHEIDLSDGAVLETGCVYVAEIAESLALPPGIAASANPKSSTGRIDVFTRVIVDGGAAFDVVPDGYAGPLYAEISPKTFPVLVRSPAHACRRSASAPAIRALMMRNWRC
jgi:dCTP deaminase